MERAVVIDTESEFDSRMAELKDNKGPVFVLFEGAHDAAGLSWCPDCTAAEPHISKMLAGAPEGTVLVRCPVKREGYAGNPSHPYRRHKGIRLKGVPTLGKWVKGRMLFPLVEAQCADDELLSEWLAESSKL